MNYSIDYSAHRSILRTNPRVPECSEQDTNRSDSTFQKAAGRCKTAGYRPIYPLRAGRTTIGSVQFSNTVRYPAVTGKRTCGRICRQLRLSGRIIRQLEWYRGGNQAFVSSGFPRRRRRLFLLFGDGRELHKGSVCYYEWSYHDGHCHCRTRRRISAVR